MKLFTLVVATVLAIAPFSVQADSDWPKKKPIKIIVPYTPGGATDITTRTLMDKVSKKIGQNIVIENRPGANGSIGVGQLAREKPDGYSFVSILMAYSINPHLYKLPYKNSDFTAVSQISTLPIFLLVSNDIPVKSVKELVEYAKTHPLTYGSSGTGSYAHLLGIYFAELAGFKMTHVPYKGSAPILTDLLSNRISLALDALLVPKPYVEQGKIKALTIFTEKRWPDTPTVPTIEEAGYKEITLSSWSGLLAPKDTPKEIINKMNQSIQEALQDPELQQKYHNLGFIPTGGSPEDLQALIDDSSALAKKIIDQNNIKVN